MELGDMRDRSLLIAVPLIVLLSAGITWALVFKTPWFRDGSGSWITDSATSYTKGDWSSYGYGDYYPSAVRELAKLQPEEFQEALEQLFNEFVKLSEAQLYMITSADDVCLSTLINCQGVPSKNVKPFLEKALAFKQNSGTVTIALWGIAISFGTLLISIGGFVITFLKFKRMDKRLDPRLRSTMTPPSSY